MEENRVETKEAIITQQTEIVDILSGKYRFHWTTINKLPSILSKGLISLAFAKRISDEESIVSIRIAPRQFQGLVLPNEIFEFQDQSLATKLLRGINLKKPFVQGRIDQLVRFMNQTKRSRNSLPIYGTSGDLYWSRRMTHEEIVQMLKEKGKVML